MRYSTTESSMVLGEPPSADDQTTRTINCDVLCGGVTTASAAGATPGFLEVAGRGAVVVHFDVIRLEAVTTLVDDGEFLTRSTVVIELNARGVLVELVGLAEHKCADNRCQDHDDYVSVVGSVYCVPVNRRV